MKRQNLDNQTKCLEAVCFRGTESPVVVIRAEHRGNMVKHIHDFTELVLVIEGTAMHEFGSCVYRINQGDCFIIKPGTLHAYHSCDGLKIVNILIRTSFIREYDSMLKKDWAYSLLLGRRSCGGKKNPGASICQENLDICMRIVTEIERERKEMKISHAMMMTGLLLELLVNIFRSTRSASVATDDTRSPWLSKVLDYLETHFAEDIPIGLLQKMAGMSERSFQRHFRRMTGLTPLKYILRLRVAHASRLLREGNKSVYEVAYRCGFSNCSYFCRFFKSVTGHSPKKCAK